VPTYYRQQHQYQSGDEEGKSDKTTKAAAYHTAGKHHVQTGDYQQNGNNLNDDLHFGLS
jgi:hypothetical protein